MHDATISDESLLERFARERDRAAAGELAERYRDLLYDLTLRILRDPADAGDATQSAFLNALRGAAGFRRESSVKTWLYGIAIRESLRIRNRRQRQRNLEAPMDANLSSTGPRLDDGGKSAREAVEREVAALPEHERLAVVLHYWRGLSYGEAAEALGCAAGTVGSRLTAARERLKARLGALGFAAAAPNLEVLFIPAPLTHAPPAVRQAIASALSTAIPAAAAPAGWIAWTAGGCAAAAAVASAIWLSTPAAPVEKPVLASASAAAGAAAPPAEGAGARQDPTPPRLETTPARAGAGKAADAASPWGTVRITGVVKDRTQGIPIEGADVGLYRVWPPLPVPQVKGFPGPTVATDKNGAYRLEDSPGGPALYKVEIVNAADVLTGRFVEEITVRMPTADSAPPPSDPDADPVPWRRNARMRFGGFAPFQVVEALAPREARADFDVVYRPSQDDRVKSLTEPNAALVRGLRAVFVKERTPSVFGVVQAEDGSHPTDVHLRVFDKDGIQDLMKTVVLYDVKSGEFAAGPLPPGSARIEAVHAQLGYGVARDLPVSESGPTDNVVLTLRTGTAKFAGAVVNVEGRPVAGARVTVFVDALLEGGGWIPTAGEATTGKDGAFEIPRAGTNGEALRVHIHADAYRDLEARGAAGDTSARLVVKPRVYVRGKLVAKDTGKPLQADPMKFIFVDIDVTPSSPEPSRVKAQFQTAREALHLDASGGFVVEARPGRNDVRVLFDGYKPFVKLGVVVEDDGLDVGTIELEPRKK